MLKSFFALSLSLFILFSKVSFATLDNFKKSREFLFYNGESQNKASEIFSFKNFHSELDEIFSETPYNIEKQLNIINDIDSQRLKEIISEILETPDLLKKVFERSSLHPAGFYKFVLLEGNQRKGSYVLRLHVWPANYNKPILDAKHIHTFDLVSKIFFGGFLNLIYENNNQEDLFSCLDPIFFNNLNQKIESLSKKTSEKLFSFLDYFQIDIQSREKILSLKDDYPFYPNNFEKSLQDLLFETELTKEEILYLAERHQSYSIGKKENGKFGYFNIGTANIKFLDIVPMESGTYYYHNYKLPHALVLKPNVPTCTLALSSPLISGTLSTLLLREESLDKKQEEMEPLRKPSKEEFINVLKSTIEHLDNTKSAL